MIAIVDYGVGNLFSLLSSFRAIGEEAEVTDDRKRIRGASKIVLPGVGAFGDAMKKLRDSGLLETVMEEAYRGKPLLGICLGMQLLFESSSEYGLHRGLGLLKGNCRALSDVVPGDLKIPHMGWNELILKKPDHPLFRYTEAGEYVYFVHSYAVMGCSGNTAAVSRYGAEFTAAAASKNVMGTQFHPEKSGEAGLRILKAFSECGREDLC